LAGFEVTPEAEIKDLEDEPCHEDEAGDLDSKADDVESTMDEAEQESQ
jgi:hypothetical protein